jgi:uncharacterized protein YecE (DUF72 family)
VRRSRSSDQLDLFGGAAEEPPRPKGVGAAAVPAEVAALGRALPAGFRMGPSSWSFPGWAELVYDRKYPESRLAKEGLAAVAQHPLFRAVGIDRTHYAPVPAAELAAYADQVPEDFRFLVKAHEALTLARWPDRPRYGRERGLGNPLFLDTAYAAAEVVAPYVEGLGPRAGALLFQFAPQDLGSPDGFAAELHAFLRGLPRGPLYAVELRNRELLTPRYAEALADAGAVHCVNAHPRMPDVVTQARVAGVAGRPLILRWLLGRGESYADAGRRFAPFDRLVAPDPPTRRGIAHLVRAALARGQEALLTVNNNAEGSAPRSMAHLAAEVLRPDASGGSD